MQRPLVLGVFVMKYFLEKETEKIEVELERWIWCVVYHDGTELHQFEIVNGEGVFHQLNKIDQEKVWMWTLIKPDMSKRIDISMPQGGKIIHKYRNIERRVDGVLTNRERIYIFGYKDGGHCHYNFILPDDTVIQSNTDATKVVHDYSELDAEGVMQDTTIFGLFK